MRGWSIAALGLAAGATLVGRPAFAEDGPPRQEPPVVIIAPPPPLPAPEEASEERPERQDEGDKLRENGGGEVTLGSFLMAPSLAHVRFSGTGIPLQGTQRTSFSHTGRELGLAAPTLGGGELSINYLRRYVAFGIMGFYGGNFSGADAAPTPSNNVAATLVGQSSLVVYGGGVEIEGALPLGALTIRVGPTLGIRGMSMPLVGFEPTTCHSRYGDYSCPANATTDPLLFLQPRARFDVSPGGGPFFLGGYVGADVVGGMSWMGGLVVGFRTPHSELAP